MIDQPLNSIDHKTLCPGKKALKNLLDSYRWSYRMMWVRLPIINYQILFKFLILAISLIASLHAFGQERVGALIKKYRSSEVGATLEKINGVPVVDEIVYRVSIKK